MLYHVPDRRAGAARNRPPAQTRRLPDRRDGGRTPPRRARRAAGRLRRCRKPASAIRWSRSSPSRTAARQLAEVFGEVTLERYPDGLRVTEVEPVIAYLQSMPVGSQLAPAALGRIRTAVRARSPSTARSWSPPTPACSSRDKRSEERWRRCVSCRWLTPRGPFELVEREIPEPGAGWCASRSRPAESATATRSRRRGPFPGLQYPRVPGHEIAGIDRRGRRRRHRLVSRPARRRRLARRPLRILRLLPPRRLRDLPGRSADTGHHLRRRVRRLHDRAGRGARAHPRRALVHRGRTADVRRHHDLQRAAQQRRAARRPRRRPRPRRARSPRRPVRREDGLQDRRHRARQPTRGRSPSSSAHGTTSTARHRIPRPSSLKLGGAAVVLATVTNGDAMSAVLGGLRVERQAGHPRAPRRSRCRCPCFRSSRTPVDRRLALRDVHRFAGHARLQRAHRRAVDERDLPARPGRRGLRAHDERQGAVSRRAHHQAIGRLSILQAAPRRGRPWAARVRARVPRTRTRARQGAPLRRSEKRSAP